MSAAIVGGPDVKLVNLSRGGALIEIPARYPMRSAVRLKLTRASGPVTLATAKVSWAQVASIVDTRVNYHLALTFDHPLTDFEAATGVDDLPQATASVAVSEQAADHDGQMVFAERSDECTSATEMIAAIDDAIDTADSAYAAKGDSEITDQRDDDLRQQLAAALASLAETSAAKQALADRLAATDAERNSLRAELEAERRERGHEKPDSWLKRPMRSREPRCWSARWPREEAHQQALAEQRAKYDAVVAELMNTANAQEAEFQQLLAERTAARDQQYARAEYTAAELVQTRAAAERARTEFDQHRQELRRSLDMAKARCLAYEKQRAGVKREAERLLALADSPVESIPVQSPSPEPDADAGHSTAVA